MPAHAWQLKAPCLGRTEFSPREDDWDTAQGLRMLCLPLLAECGGCPFRAQCVQEVQPALSSFDGVCGGRLWIGGEVIAEAGGVLALELNVSRHRPVCGTEAAVRDHRRHGETPGLSCRIAARDAQRRRNEARKAA